jgi:UDP-N-acetyl-D-glucosamine/UDP-N-acetyl-D-galactosamine dehydrogenase
MADKSELTIIGIGYVGLPLAISLAKFFYVNAYDLNKNRIAGLKKNYDITNEFSFNEIKKAKSINFTSNEKDLINTNIFFITVPTPITKNNKPDLRNLIQATKLVSKNLKKKSIIVYESTVFPGCTEEVCLPIIEKISKLKLNKDFYLGYSPERIDPGKSKYKLKNTVKVIGASNQYSLQKLNKIYKKICLRTHLTDNIKIAEAAKIIENTQRDLNIALINELSIIFKKMNINTNKILDAASTKWNFIKFKPGLVGGHCIGVDPYYLTHKSKELKYNPKVILSGRKINDNMGVYVAQKLIQLLKKRKKKLDKCRILILGAAFKENCADIRNSRIFDTVKYLEKKGSKVYVYDPLIPSNFLKKKTNNILERFKTRSFYDAVIISVGHEIFLNMGIQKIKKSIKQDGLILDLKSVFPTKDTDWQL